MIEHDDALNYLNAHYTNYLRDLMQGHRARCANLVERLLVDGMNVRTLYEKLYQRSLYEIGVLWETNQISVAVEHAATAVTESLLPLSYQTIFSTPRIGRKAVTSCAVNEYHQIGARMVADILEMHGWDTMFLGANVPVADMMKVLNSMKPDLLCLSLSVYHQYAAFLHMIQTIRQQYPQIPILVGGQAFRHSEGHAISDIPNVTYLETLQHLEDWLE